MRFEAGEPIWKKIQPYVDSAPLACKKPKELVLAYRSSPPKLKVLTLLEKAPDSVSGGSRYSQMVLVLRSLGARLAEQEIRFYC